MPAAEPVPAWQVKNLKLREFPADPWQKVPVLERGPLVLGLYIVEAKAD
jgi:hypothetical protein